MAKLELEWKSPIPNLWDDPDRESNVFYSKYYNFRGRNRKNVPLENKEDSPDASRLSLIKRTHPYINSLNQESYVLDLGAGRQIFEKEYTDQYGKKPASQIITVDIANIPQDRLLAKDYQHIRATGRSLPFGDEKFDAVISNMAFDFILPEGLTELHRVTKPGAVIFLNLHHPKLVNYDVERNLQKLTKKISYKIQAQSTIREKDILQLAVYRHHKHLRDNRSLFETEKEIQEVFARQGFGIKGIEIKSDLRDKWWEVDLVKPHQANNVTLFSK